MLRFASVIPRNILETLFSKKRSQTNHQHLTLKVHFRKDWTWKLCRV
jgi:hypothetical protein